MEKKFDFKEPYLYKDKDNKKWCVRYAIKYPGEQDFTHIKEYGRNYYGHSLNLVEDLQEREDQFRVLILALKKHLKDGVDKRKPKEAKVYSQQKAKEAEYTSFSNVNKYDFDYCLNFYLQHKGLINPVVKKEQSAMTLKMFLKNQFRPFLESKNLLSDIRKITKSHLLEFVNYYYLNPDPEIKWSNNTYNSKRSYLGSFFSLLLDEEVIEVNPVLNIKRKPTQATERFGIFTKEEIELLFAHLDKKYQTIGTIAKVLYYSYIRSSEISRLKVGDFLIDANRIRVSADIAKTQKDGLVRFVVMRNVLKTAVINYLNKHSHQPNMFMFGKGKKPASLRIGKGWQADFAQAVEDLRKEHPNLFNRNNLTLYALKHTGVTHFIQDNRDKFNTTQLLQFIQQQCRHENFTETQKYWRQLGFTLDEAEQFIDL